MVVSRLGRDCYDRLMRPRTKKWLLVVLVVVALVALAIPLFGFRRVMPLGPPTNSQFSYDTLGSALRHVRDGRVDYEALVNDPAPLEAFVSSIAEMGPRSTPRHFADENAELAYYINAYNAFALLGVVRNWPIESVHDVHGLIEPKAGFGFFYGQHFRLDGRYINLYDLEHEVLRAFGDARVHAAINCASASCPALAPTPYQPHNLERSLTVVARAFSSAPHVRISEVVELNPIYSWYAEDFLVHERHMRSLEGGALDPNAPQEPAEAEAEAGAVEEAEPTPVHRDVKILDFIARFASPTERAALRLARESETEVRYFEYDWSLNGIGAE